MYFITVTLLDWLTTHTDAMDFIITRRNLELRNIIGNFRQYIKIIFLSHFNQLKLSQKIVWLIQSEEEMLTVNTVL